MRKWIGAILLTAISIKIASASPITLACRITSQVQTNWPVNTVVTVSFDQDSPSLVFASLVYTNGERQTRTGGKDVNSVQVTSARVFAESISYDSWGNKNGIVETVQIDRLTGDLFYRLADRDPNFKSYAAAKCVKSEVQPKF